MQRRPEIQGGSMFRFTIPGIICTTLLLVAISIGCSNKGNVSPLVPVDEGDTNEVSIYLGDAVTIDDLVSVPLFVSGAEAVSAISLRIGFNEEYLEPIGVEWSPEFVDGGSTFQLFNQRNYLPLAFAKAGETIGSSNALEICRLRFRLKDGVESIPWIIDDPDHLVAYDLRKTRLAVLTGGDVE
jgi:hypothetical protein